MDHPLRSMTASHTRLLHIFTALAALCVVPSLPAQNLKYARTVFAQGNYFEAIREFEKLLVSEPNNAEYNEMLGLCYLRTNIDPRLALDYLLTAEKGTKAGSELPLYLAQAYMHHLQYDQALEQLQKYEREGKKRKKQSLVVSIMMAHCHAAPDLLKYPVDVTFQNTGKGINSQWADYHPFVTKDEQLLLFTSRRKGNPGAKPEFDGYFPSNIYQATRNGEKWTEATKLGEKINSSFDEQVVGITDSGDSLFFYIDHVNKMGDIYMAVKRGKNYTDANPLEGVVNSPFLESACSISRDGKTFIFSSDRLGGYGGLDIWMVRRLPNGSWAPAVNLGPEINTPLNEDFPTLSGDGNTLYFCSDGHPGMGMYDIYFSSWDEQTGSWTKPQNMGYPINTPGNDKTISFNADGNKAYISALRDEGYGDLDLYEITFNSKQTEGPAIFQVNVINPSGSTILAKAALRAKNEFDELIGEYYPNEITGRYILALHPGKYFLQLDVPGLKPYTESLVVNQFHVKHEQNVKIVKLQP